MYLPVHYIGKSPPPLNFPPIDCCVAESRNSRNWTQEHGHVLGIAPVSVWSHG